MKLNTQEKALIRLALIAIKQSPPDWMDDTAREEVSTLTNRFTKELS